MEDRTPRDIDEELAEAEYSWIRAELRAQGIRSTIETIESGKPSYRYLAERLPEYRQDLAELGAEKAAAQVIIDAADAEWKRRGYWSRYFLVPGGHVHKSRGCSSCYITTQFAWLPGASGQDGAGLIDMFRTKVCTVCFPEAPVDRLQAEDIAAKKAKDLAEGRCEGHGKFSENPKLQYVMKRGTCPVCKRTVSVTSTGKCRKHYR